VLKRKLVQALIAAALAALAALAGNQVAKSAEPFDSRECQRMPLLHAAEGDPSAACVTLTTYGAACSGTCIATEDGRSLVVSCNHCFVHAVLPGGDLPKASYPLPCTVYTNAGRTKFAAIAVDGGPDVDASFIVVEGVLPVAKMATKAPPVGADVWHRGLCSTYTRGKVVANPRWAEPKPTDLFRSTCNSCPGDSGCGVFSGSEMVAVNWGLWVQSRNQAGTPIGYIKMALKYSTSVKAVFPQLVADLVETQEPPIAPPADVLPLPPITMPPNPPMPPSVAPCLPCPPCPPCPPTRRGLFPNRPRILFR
jgi:hypothetical protein